MKDIEEPTLARKIGDAAHVSPLLRKAMRLSGCNREQVGEWLLKCAVERGASHYQRCFCEDLPPDQPELADEEIGVALCLGEHRYNSSFIRAAAQLLSSPQIDPQRVSRLALMERVEPILLHIAAAAATYAPAAEPWKYLRAQLSPRKITSTADLPHWSRFVSQTGVTPYGGGPAILWLSRRERSK